MVVSIYWERPYSTWEYISDSCRQRGLKPRTTQHAKRYMYRSTEPVLMFSFSSLASTNSAKWLQSSVLHSISNILLCSLSLPPWRRFPITQYSSPHSIFSIICFYQGYWATGNGIVWKGQWEKWKWIIYNRFHISTIHLHFILTIPALSLYHFCI